MFHWICPECGHEIAPTARECPVCDPSADAAEPALVGVVEAPTARLLDGEAPTARLLEREAPTARHTDGKAPAARRSPQETPPEIPADAAPSVNDELLPEFGDGKPPDPLGVLAALLEPPAQAVPPRQSFRAGTHAVPLALRALIAELGPVAEHPRLPIQDQLQLKPATESPQRAGKAVMAIPRHVSGIARPFGALLLPAPWTPSRPAPPGTPQQGPAPSLAPLTRYNPLEGRPLRPAAPAPGLRKSECGPRMTLAAPALIQPLIRFQDQELNPIPAAAGRIKQPLRIPRWLTSAMMIGTMMAAGFNGFSLFLTRPSGETKSTAADAAPVAAAPAVSAASPLSKAIEVTGFRVQMDPQQKAEIQYLVVNHTANAISGVTVYVTLRAASAPAGQAPIAKFQFAAPNLGAYQSKEMASAIERVARPIAVPDWQELRADVEIGR